ncbi:MAG: AMP-binding protein [Candidatus Binatia bacterium]
MPTPSDHARTSPDKLAVQVVESGEALTYADLDAAANRFARLLHEQGLRPGDHMAFCIENRAQFLAIAWGAHYAGCYYTAISTRLTPEEAAYIIENCQARVVVCSEATRAAIAPLRQRCDAVERWLSLDSAAVGFESYDVAVAAYAPEPLADRREGQDMLYSSGTTGRPKGVKVPLPRGTFGKDTGVAVLGAALFGFDTDIRYLSPAPLYHAAPLRFCMATQRVGGTAVVQQKFDPETTLATIASAEITHAQFVPTMFVRMLKLSEADRTRHNLSSLRCAIHAAAPCPVEVKRRMIDWWGPIVHEYYAGTEGNGLTHASSSDWLAHPGTVGKPILGTLHILDDDGNELGPREIGGVFFSDGPGFEYHGDPEKTAGSRVGSSSTLGDIGYVDEDGFLFLTDRKAHMIISGGVNIYPQEAENVLTMHPAVADVAVIGVPNEDFGEEVKAVVQPLEMPAGDQAASALEEELIAYCRERLADFKCPRTVDFREELPRHPTGKLYKRLLKDEYWKQTP